MRKNPLFFSLLALILSLFFLNSFFTPWQADDYTYRLFYLGPDSALLNILRQLRHHYFAWGGRMLAHLMAASALALGSKLLVSVIGLVAILLSSYLALRFLLREVDLRDPSTRILTALVVFAQVVGAKACLQTEYWTVGAANYLWTLPFLFLFLYLMREFFETGRSPLSLKLVLSAVLVGQTNENVGLSLVATLLVFHWWDQRRFWPGRNLTIVLINLLASSTILILAPGNRVRALQVHPLGAPPPFARIGMWFESLAVFLGRPDILTVILVLGLIYWRFRGAGPQPSSNRLPIALLILSLFMGLAYLGDDGNFYGRKAFQMSQVFGIGLAAFVYQCLDLKRVSQRLALLLLIFANLRLGYDFQRIFRFHEAYQEREAEILKQKGAAEITAPSFTGKTPYNLDDLNADPDNWVNAAYAQFLGVNKLRGAL